MSAVHSNENAMQLSWNTCTRRASPYFVPKLHPRMGLRCVECLRKFHYNPNIRRTNPCTLPAGEFCQLPLPQTIYSNSRYMSGTMCASGIQPIRRGSTFHAALGQRASADGPVVSVFHPELAYSIKTTQLRRTAGQAGTLRVSGRRRYSMPCSEFRRIQPRLNETNHVPWTWKQQTTKGAVGAFRINDKRLRDNFPQRYKPSNGIMLEQKHQTPPMRRGKKPSTPPPVQFRSIRLEQSNPNGMNFTRSNQYIPVASDTIMQLVASRKNFGSSESVRDCPKSHPRKGIIATLAKAKLWKRPQIKKLLKTKQNTEGKSSPNANVTEKESCSNSKTVNKLTKSESAGLLPRKILPSSPHPVRSKLSTRGSTLAEFANEALVCRLWEEYEEIFSKTKSVEESKEHRKSWHEGLTMKCGGDNLLPVSQISSTIDADENLRLEDIIHDPQSLKTFLSIKFFAWSFRRFLQSEFSEENLDFWLECQDFKSKSPSKQRKIAPKIYEKYLKENALREVNITRQIRKIIEDKIEDPAGVYESLFDEAQNHIYELMSTDSFKRFLNSEIYDNLTKTLPSTSTTRKRVSPIPEPSLNKKSKH